MTWRSRTEIFDTIWRSKDKDSREDDINSDQRQWVTFISSKPFDSPARGGAGRTSMTFDKDDTPRSCGNDACLQRTLNSDWEEQWQKTFDLLAGVWRNRSINYRYYFICTDCMYRIYRIEFESFVCTNTFQISKRHLDSHNRASFPSRHLNRFDKFCSFTIKLF